MKRVFVFVMLAVFLVSVMSSTVSAALMGNWVPTVRAVRAGDTAIVEHEIIDAVAQLNADLLTFEGLLKAYSFSVDGMLNPLPHKNEMEEQVFLASNEISASLDALNSELTDAYKDLSKEQQSVVEDAYLSLGSYLEKLAEEANLIFQDEDGKAKAQFEVQEVGIIFENLPNQLWVGSVISV